MISSFQGDIGNLCLVEASEGHKVRKVLTVSVGFEEECSEHLCMLIRN